MSEQSGATPRKNPVPVVLKDGSAAAPSEFVFGQQSGTFLGRLVAEAWEGPNGPVVAYSVSLEQPKPGDDPKALMRAKLATMLGLLQREL